RQQIRRIAVLQFSNGARIGNREYAAADSPKRSKVRGAAGESSKVTGERADVRTSAACDRHVERRSVAPPNAPRVHVDSHRVEREGSTGARGDIRALSRALLCRVVGGPLL